MRKRLCAALLAAVMLTSLGACGGQTAAPGPDAAAPADAGDAGVTEVQVFAAASLGAVMAEFEKEFEEAHPDVDILVNADSSGALLTQIQEGAPCDVFFSAAQKQMNALEEAGLLVEGTRKNVINNQLVVVTQPGSGTAVTGLADIGKAGSIALADGSVPVGKYTRQALMNLGLLEEREDPASFTTAEVSEALGGVEISEQGNVSKVLTAVAEASSEVGTTYLSDTYGHENEVAIIEKVPYDVTGDIIYPVARVVNPDADAYETEMAAAFVDHITNDAAKAKYRQYLFDPDVD